MTHALSFPSVSTSPLSRIAEILGLDATSRRYRRIYRDTVLELESFSDRELADINISRLSIDDIAHEHARRTC